MELTPIEKEFQESIVHMFMQAGANMLLSKVGAILFSEPKEISLEELSQRSGYSLPSVSNAVKLLEHAGKIQRHKKSGDKKIYVSFKQDLIKSMQEQIIKGHEVIIKPMRKNMPVIIEELKRELKSDKLSPEKKQDLKDKIEWYSCYVQQIKTLENIFGKINILFSDVNTHDKTNHRN